LTVIGSPACIVRVFCNRQFPCSAINEALDKFDLKFPKADEEAGAALDPARAQLERER